MPSIRILLDQNAPIGLRHALGPHKVMTAAHMGWDKIENGELIRAAEAAGFSVLITCDRNIRYQQNLSDRVRLACNLSSRAQRSNLPRSVPRLVTREIASLCSQ